MTALPPFDTLSGLLLIGLLGAALGERWGYRRGRAEGRRAAELEREAVTRSTWLWYQRAQQAEGQTQQGQGQTSEAGR